MIRESDALKLGAECEFRQAIESVNARDAEEALKHILKAASFLGAVPAIAHYKEGASVESLDPASAPEWNDLGAVCGHFLAAFCGPTAATPSNCRN